MTTAYCDELIAHYARAWVQRPVERHWECGPTNELPREFSVLEFAPSKTRAAWTYATCCMSQPAGASAIELHLFSPVQSERLVELLTAIGHFHRTGNQLELGHTVNFGRPWLTGSSCTYGLVSLPYLDGPTVEEFRYSGSLTRCLWLIPVTPQEREYKIANGLSALEQQFEQAQFDYLDATRPSVI